MTYNPYSAVNAIYKLKGQWDSANNENDTEKKNNAAKAAQTYYNRLRRSGYADVADELAASNYTQAKAIHDKWATMGKTPTRDYLYSLGKSKGMSASDVDKLIDWNDKTGEISFGGKKIGVPDITVDGVSYWKDTTGLDNAFNDYISRSGTTFDTGIKNAAYNQNMFSAKNKNDELFNTIKSDHDNVNDKYGRIFDYANSDVTKSDEYQSAFKNIMPSYDYAAMLGRDDALASNAGYNSGNIDSFAAANAARQQAALTAKGQQIAHQAGIEAYNARIQNARNILSELGVYNNNTYSAMNSSVNNDSSAANNIAANEQTALNNDTTRKSEIASVSGYTPNEWSVNNDAFIRNFVDENGKLKDEYKDTDFQELINNAKANGNTELAKKYSILRGLKIFGNFSEYGKYLNQGDIGYQEPQRTENARQFDEQIAAGDRALEAEQFNNAADRQLQRDVADKNAQLTRDQFAEAANSGTKPTLTAAQATAAIKNGEVSQAVIDAYNHYYGTSYTVDNPPKLNESSASGGSESGKPLSEKEVKEWVDYLNGAIESKYPNKTALTQTGKNEYKRADADADYIIIKVFSSNDLTQEQKEYLLYDKFGITEDQVNAALKDAHYRR